MNLLFIYKLTFQFPRLPNILDNLSSLCFFSPFRFSLSLSLCLPMCPRCPCCVACIGSDEWRIILHMSPPWCSSVPLRHHNLSPMYHNDAREMPKWTYGQVYAGQQVIPTWCMDCPGMRLMELLRWTHAWYIGYRNTVTHIASLKT